jgi:glutathione S-transferase
MMLIGMFDSPFVRRVAISMRRLGMPFEHADWSVGRDLDRIRRYNPIGKVPTLVLDDGESLIESAAILDYLDDLAGPERALLPAHGERRRTAQRLMAAAIGAADKGREQIYERVFRPIERRHEPWIERCSAQMHGGLQLLERYCERGEGPWLLGSALTQADITVSCAYTFTTEALQLADAGVRYPKLTAAVVRCEALPEFVATHVPFFTPTPAKSS